MPATLLPVATRPLRPPQDDATGALLASLPRLQERDIVVVTSKIVAIEQGRCVELMEGDKERLIEEESDLFIPKASSKYGITLSIKENTLIASGGVDESNGDGYCILWPTDSAGWAEQFCRLLKERFGLRELAVIVTDSHCVPMRWGVVGISIGFYGLEPLTDYRGKPDIFGRPLHVTQGNIPDAVAAAAVGVMGEGDECTPAVVVREWPRVTFTDAVNHAKFRIEPESDIFAPLLQAFTKRKP